MTLLEYSGEGTPIIITLKSWPLVVHDTKHMQEFEYEACWETVFDYHGLEFLKGGINESQSEIICIHWSTTIRAGSEKHKEY